MNPPSSSFLVLLYLSLLFPPNTITGTSHATGEVGVLSSSSRWIVDQNGRRVKLACANWAAHLEPVMAEGLDKHPLDDIAGAVRSMGFNCVRLTWPDYLATKASIASLTVNESLRRLGLVDSADAVAVNNPQILNRTLMEAFKDVVSTLEIHNIMVILDNQISIPGWCCSKFDGNGFFGDEYFDTDEWIESLKIMAATFNSSSNVIGMSLRNELRGPRQNVADWYRYMQMGAEAVHSMNPTALVILSGLDFDKTLTFLYDKQVELTFKGKLVFELHWYGFSDGGDWENGNINVVCGNVSKNMLARGGFLLEQGWPLFLSEFGVDIRGNNPGDNHFLSCFLSVAAELDLDWAIWALQGSYYIREGQPNLDETYGVLSWDWSKPRNTNFLQRISAIQSPFQGPGLSNRSLYNVIFHPLTGLCVLQNKMNRKPVLGSCAEYEAWNYTSGHNLVLKDSGLCLIAEAEDNEVKFGTNCESLSSKWELITDSQMLLSTKINSNGSIVCLDINPDNNLITSSCKCLVEEGSCSGESQWFKIVYSNREESSSFSKLLSV
ncbi:glycosyl hydrolase 5 family protein [Dendrobium catenatum]|uniref:Glycoside hydrolase family 5 domain-containing protein n=1 Tax=Dendrobium catenatum TaxID=906689 RepID=A0A2I0WVZ6_9ASPA|nr:glycosyl hydrolase 5 family protein [Dendrobium catenatum]PKU79835.1 hypothetical protein MA16_Dca016280 [Dendrobium catenatum]